MMCKKHEVGERGGGADKKKKKEKKEKKRKKKRDKKEKKNQMPRKLRKIVMIDSQVRGESTSLEVEYFVLHEL